MRSRQFTAGFGVALSVIALLGACHRSRTTASHSVAPPGITLIDPGDTAAYSSAGPDAIAAIARCQPPACRPDIFSGPGPGELTVGLDSGRPSGEVQWHRTADVPPSGGQAFQDSSWRAMLTHWEAAAPQRLLLIDGEVRTYEYAREHVGMSDVWGVKEVAAEDARALSRDPKAANGAVVITTKAHAPSTR